MMPPVNAWRTTARCTTSHYRAGPGRAIRSRAETAPIPVYVASLGPANLRLTGELADGWIGNSFFPATADVFFDPIREVRSTRRSLDDVDRVVAVSVDVTDDDPGDRRRAPPRRRVRLHVRRHGLGDEELLQRRSPARATATTSPRCNASGRRATVAQRRHVPIEIGLGTNLIGPPTTIRDRLAEYERSEVTTLRVSVDGAFGKKVADLELLVGLATEAGASSTRPPDHTTPHHLPTPDQQQDHRHDDHRRRPP